MCGFMTKKNPAVHYQDVALEVPEGDLVDLLYKSYINIGEFFKSLLDTSSS